MTYNLNISLLYLIHCTSYAKSLFSALFEGAVETRESYADEAAVDAWIASVQVLAVNLDSNSVQDIHNTAKIITERAKHSGDAARLARVKALHGFALAETPEDLPAFLAAAGEIFDEAERIDDRFALAIRSLALGRWYVGVGGIELSKSLDENEVPNRALDHLHTAEQLLMSIGMHPWALYTQIQMMKAFADLRDFDSVHAMTERVDSGVDRFPIFASHFHEAVGQIHRMRGNHDAASQHFTLAIENAKIRGLLARHADLIKNFEASGEA